MRFEDASSVGSRRGRLRRRRRFRSASGCGCTGGLLRARKFEPWSPIRDELIGARGDGALPGDSLRQRRVPGSSVILPAFNEESNVGPMVDAALEVLPSLADDYEVLIVDDGSRDATGSVARDLVDRHYPAVRLLAHQGNRATALRFAPAFSTPEEVSYTDADRQFDISELAYFLPLAAENDLVIGFRVYRYDTMVRSMVSWVYNRLVGVLFRVGVRDVDCAFKLIRREVVDKLPLQSDDFFIDTEIVALPEVELPHRAEGRSSLPAGRRETTVAIAMFREPSGRSRECGCASTGLPGSSAKKRS